MSESPAEHEEVSRYSIWTGVTLVLAFAASPLFAWYALGSETALIRAVGILVIPTFVVTWIFTTIQALHLRDLRYWELRSTYVSLGFSALAIVLLVLSAVDKTKLNETLLTAGGLAFGGAMLWCAWFNWMRTRSLFVAISVTLIQTVVGLTILAILFQLFTGRRDSDRT